MSTVELARWATTIRYETLPQDVIAKAKDVIFDCLGASVFTGAKKPWGKVTAEFAELNGGGQAESTIISTGRKTLASQAALANGTMAEGFELGDFDCNTATRPQPMIVPAVLALAEARKRNGRAVLESVVAGYDVNFRVGLGINPAQRGKAIMTKGFYSGSMIGTFGAAAGAGRMIGLDPQHMTWALGIASALTGGFLQGHEEGAWTRRLTAGMASARGVTAALMAERGFVGPEKGLEGEAGFYKVMADNQYSMDELVGHLGSPYKILQTWLKAYPMNGTLHAPVEALLNIMRAQGLTGADIEKIDAAWYQYFKLLGKKHVDTIVAAQASLPYALAAAAVAGRMGVEEFTEEMVRNPEVIAMIDRIDVVDAPELYQKVGRESVPGRVTVMTRDGRSFTEEVLYPKGHPRNLMSPRELRDKFDGLTEGALSRATGDRIHEMVMNLEQVEDVSAILQLCTAGA